jgi:two-component system CheB/CheR fusion protein
MHQRKFNYLSVNSSSIQPEEKTPDSTKPSPPIAALALPTGESSIFESLFAQVPADLGFAYIIMEYGPAGSTPASGPSSLYAKLNKRTAMPVIVPGRNTPLEKDHIYLLPPGTSVNLVRGRLTFGAGISIVKSDSVIDLFAATVASGAPGRAVVIVPSAAATRATTGLRVVRTVGGFVFALEEKDPLFSPPIGRTGFVDFTLSPGRAVEKLRSLAGYLHKGQADPADKHPELSRIYLQLLHRRGIDFSRYRQPDVLRCIRRRMAIHALDTLESYLAFLQEEEEEVALLHDELQTGIAGFFLEPAIEHALVKDILPALLARRSGESPLRVWIPHCNGGQQASSFAIALSEYMESHNLNIPIQIFATDLNKLAIDRARIGIYEDSELHNISPQRIKKFFARRMDGYHLSKSIREMCVFATQNFLKDPPFSHIDIILGPNALVGLGPEERKKIFRAFHYALNPSGYLVLGRLRTSDNPDYLFHLLTDNPGIFLKKDVPATFDTPVLIPSYTAGEQEADRLLLSGYVPAAFLVDEQFRVIRFYGNADPYLRQESDRPSLHLLRILRDDLVFELDELIQQADKEGKAAKKEGIPSGEHPGYRQLSVEVVPLRSFGRKWRLVIIREWSPAEKTTKTQKPGARNPTAKDLRITALEKELNEMRGLLLAANEESRKAQEALQIANEEMMASNEELRSINEELVGLNEELKAAREELLSFNIELNTMNEDLYVRNQELQLSGDYAHAVIASIRQPLVVLQDDRYIRKANPAFYRLFRLVPEDVTGMSLYSIGDGILDQDDLRRGLRQMQSKKLASVDLECKILLPSQGERILSFSFARMQKVSGIRPGILLTVEDITDRKMADRFKDEFIGIASHELKTPATSIQAYSQLLYDELAETNDQRSVQLVSKLNTQVSRLTHLAKDLLDVTRISQGQIALRLEYFNLNQLITETVEELQVTTKIRLVIAGLSTAQPFRGDRSRIRQVLVNLLTNAMKYSPASEEIIVHAESTAQQVRISIQDFGIGMSTDTLQKIFDRFYRSEDPSTIRHPGIGLGLYISSEIVRRHGGDITVSSERGKGSIFTITLPLTANK